MNKHKCFWLIAVVLSALIILICMLPLVQHVNRTVQGIRFKNGEAEEQIVEISLAGLKKNYLFREDKLDVSLTISDIKVDIWTIGKIFPEHNGIYFVTIVYYDPTENRCNFGRMLFDKELSVLILEGVNESTYVASSKTNVDLEEIFQIYSN